jgi:hypothetical protein
MLFVLINLEKYDEWKDDPDMIGDVMRFLDNVLSDFIHKAQINLKMQNIQLREKEVLD